MSDALSNGPPHAGPSPPATGRWTVDLWFDPACPLSRVTADWLVTVAARRPVDIRWRVMSLSVLNEGRDVDPEGDEHGYLWIPARVCVAVRNAYGHKALSELYDALWTAPGGGRREWVGDLAEGLEAAGLPKSLAAAGHTTDHDTALRASHGEAMSLVAGEVGTPVLAVTRPDGRRHAFFGPVLTRVPGEDDALRLWEGTLLVASVPGFREIKT
ncbi:disulfide bond formation protein DsbA [Streptomyces sp. NBC_01498]|uniref:mycothiol-dependent nitroreductase Rv2466c family protein n=1 Tax=Streptomyces sp. NBC_01498 TaxID=2975870 RepID=UPI002E7B7E22|nr:disulfide bond formation protein DsbA [Streptomyces sp. NBC_01498]WTL26725.1 disulfide bond formation protein DsbA [Streptomyces sp. NBC_01498]